MTQTAIRVTVSLNVDHPGVCADLARPLYLQLSRGPYDRCSVLAVPADVQDWRWQHRTARKRAGRAARFGYRFEIVDRHEHADDIFQINTSLERRQGRPMADSYRRRQDYQPLPEYPCRLHRVTTYGVLQAHRLVAYLWLYRCGELALVSSILGHGDHLENDVMYLLMQGTVDAETGTGGMLVYNRHDSGSEGLRYYKERCGFTEQRVEWLP